MVSLARGNCILLIKDNQCIYSHFHSNNSNNNKAYSNVVVTTTKFAP